MIADKIKLLREQKKLTQSELAHRLGITRSGVNAWEMGITVPSTQYIVELSEFFKVSTDFLLDMPATTSVYVDGLTDKEISIIVDLIEYMKNKNTT